MLDQVATKAARTNLAPIPMECDAPHPESHRRIAARAQRHALSQRPQPAIRGARRALVRRRRHAARLPSRERPRQLSQPLGPHPEMAGRARRRPRAVRRLRPQAAGCARRRHPGRRRRQHQHHLPCRPPAGAGGRPSADRDRARHAQPPRLLRLQGRHHRPLHRASQDRSRHRRDGVLRLQRRGPADPCPLLRIGQCVRRGDAVRPLRGALCQHGARLHRHRKPPAVSDPAHHRQHGARDARQAALRLGAGERRLCRRHEAQRLGQGHRLVPRRKLLRLPRHERVGRRRPHHRRRHAVRGSAAVHPSRRLADRSRRNRARGCAAGPSISQAIPTASRKPISTI